MGSRLASVAVGYRSVVGGQGRDQFDAHRFVGAGYLKIATKTSHSFAHAAQPQVIGIVNFTDIVNVHAGAVIANS